MFKYETESVTYDEFEEALIGFCIEWVEEFATPILKDASKLYENHAVRYVLMRYKEANDDYERGRELYMRQVLMGDDDPIKPSKFDANRRHELQMLVYDMLKVSE